MKYEVEQMKKWMASITAVLAFLVFSVPALAAEAAAPEKGGRGAAYIICVILLICAVIIYFKRKG